MQFQSTPGLKSTGKNWSLLKAYASTFFNTDCLLLDGVTPTVWTIGVVIPYHTGKLLDKLGYGLGLNSVQGMEAKHIRLPLYVCSMGLSVEANTSHLSTLSFQADTRLFKISAGSTSKPSKYILLNRYFAFFRSVTSKMISVLIFVSL